jgi:hypothetical protein
MCLRLPTRQAASRVHRIMDLIRRMHRSETDVLQYPTPQGCNPLLLVLLRRSDTFVTGP